MRQEEIDAFVLNYVKQRPRLWLTLFAVQRLLESDPAEPPDETARKFERYWAWTGRPSRHPRRGGENEYQYAQRRLAEMLAPLIRARGALNLKSGDKTTARLRSRDRALARQRKKSVTDAKIAILVERVIPSLVHIVEEEQRIKYGDPQRGGPGWDVGPDGKQRRVAPLELIYGQSENTLTRALYWLGRRIAKDFDREMDDETSRTDRPARAQREPSSDNDDDDIMPPVRRGDPIDREMRPDQVAEDADEIMHVLTRADAFLVRAPACRRLLRLCGWCVLAFLLDEERARDCYEGIGWNVPVAGTPTNRQVVVYRARILQKITGRPDAAALRGPLTAILKQGAELLPRAHR